MENCLFYLSWWVTDVLFRLWQGLFRYLSASPQHFRYYFNGGAEIVVSRDRQGDEEDQQPQKEDDDSKREEFLSEGAETEIVVPL